MSALSDLQNQVKNLKKCCRKALCITYEEALLLVANNGVRSGVLYRISGVHKNKTEVTIPVLYDDGTNSGTTIYVWGLSSNEFSSEGWGEFYNPRYDQTNYGTTDLRVGQSLDITTPGSDYSSTSNVAVTGGSGTGMTVTVIDDSGGLVSVIVESVGSGYVNGDVLTISDGNDDATVTLNLLPYLYNIWDGNNPFITVNYSVIGRKTIWGGYVWQNQTGLIGAALSSTELNPEDWSKIAYNTTDYIKVIDYIEYDWANDWISRRRCSEKVIDVTFPYQYWNSVENTYGVVLHGIAVTQWGNHYNAVTELGNGLVIVNDAYYENVNFKGKLMLGIEADMYSVNRNCYFGINTEHRTVRLKGKSYQTNNIFDTGGKQIDLLLENQSWQDLIVIRNSSHQTSLRLSNGWQDGQDDFVLDNNSYQYNVQLIGGSYQSGINIFDNNSGESNVIYKNGAYSNHNFNNNSLFSNSMVDSTVIGFTIDNCTKNNLQFINGSTSGIYPTDSNSAEHNSVYSAGYNEFYIDLILSSGSVGNGAVGNIVIPKFELCDDKMYIEEVLITCGVLTAGPGAYITLGIVTDDVDSGLDAVSGLAATISNSTHRYTTLPFTKTVAADRYLVMAVGANGISGAVSIYVRTRRS